MTLRESHYREKQPHRARGTRELDRLVGGVDAEIRDRLALVDRVRVLELGCGYGTALLELAQRYGERIELHGVNRFPNDGDRDVLERNAAERGLVDAATRDAFRWPIVHHGDVAQGLPYPDASFDLVYSQVAWLYFGDKLGVLREVARVLDPRGLAKIDADELRAGLPPELARLVEIWDGGVVLPFGDYLERHGAALAPAPEGHYIRLPGGTTVGDDVELVQQLDVSRLHVHWDGIKCVYRLRR